MRGSKPIINVKTKEPIIITLKQNREDVEIYLESKDGKWKDSKLYATIRDVSINELDTNLIRYWVEETYYEWNYDMDNTNMISKYDFLSEACKSKKGNKMKKLKELRESILSESSALNEKFEFLNVITDEVVCTGKNMNVCINQLNKQLNELNLEEANFMHLDLTRASFSNSKLTEAYFGACDLTGASFSDTTCDHVIYEDCDLTNAKFINADVQKTQFINCVMTNVNFNNANIHGLYIDENCANKDTIKY